MCNGDTNLSCHVPKDWSSYRVVDETLLHLIRTIQMAATLLGDSLLSHGLNFVM